MIELDLSRAKQAMQDIGKILSTMLGGAKSDTKQVQNSNELIAAVRAINQGTG